MSNPLKILTYLTASKAAQFREGLDVNSNKITGLADGTASNDAAAYGQLTYLSSSVSGTIAAIEQEIYDLSGSVSSSISASDAYALALSSSVSSSISASDAYALALSSSVSSSISASDAYALALSSSVSSSISASNAYSLALSSSVSSSFSASKEYVNDLSSSVAYSFANEALERSYLSSSISSSIAEEAQQREYLSGAISDRIDLEEQARLALEQQLYAETQAREELSSSVSSSISASNAYSLALSSSVSSSFSASNAYSLQLSSSFSASLSASLAAAGGYSTDLSSSVSSSLYTLSSSVSSSIAAEAQARADEDLTFLKLDGSRSMQGSLVLGNNDLTQVKDGYFGGNVLINGNLQVDGALTYINTTNLDVTDKLVTLAKGATNGAAADGAGIEVDGAGVSFTYDNFEGKWVSDIGLKVAGEVKFESALKLSGSQFTSISTPVVDDKFDVSDAIHALDQKIYDRTVSINNFYNERRLVITGTLSSGTETINLTANSANIFHGSQMDYIALDIMIDTDGSGYTNDLVAVKMFVFGAGTLMVTIDAPASPSAKFRLIAVNEKNSDTIP